MAKSEWKVQCNYIAGVGRSYIAMRVLDTSQTVHSGNVEHYGEYSEDREEIRRLVERLNRQEDRDVEGAVPYEECGEEDAK